MHWLLVDRAHLHVGLLKALIIGCLLALLEALAEALLVSVVRLPACRRLLVESRLLPMLPQRGNRRVDKGRCL